MRITEGIISGRNLADLQRANAAVAKASHAGLDRQPHARARPTTRRACRRALNLRGDLAATAQYMDTASASQGWAQATDDALSEINDVLQRAREAVVQGGNGTIEPEGPQRHRHADRPADRAGEGVAATRPSTASYIFAGHEDRHRPLRRPTAPTPTTATPARSSATIGPGVSVQLNGSIGSVLGNGSDGKALQVLRDIATHLRGGTAADTNALRTTDLSALDASIGRRRAPRAPRPARTPTASTTAANRLTDLQTSTEKLRSGVEDAIWRRRSRRCPASRPCYQAALQARAPASASGR